PRPALLRRLRMAGGLGLDPHRPQPAAGGRGDDRDGRRFAPGPGGAVPPRADHPPRVCRPRGDPRGGGGFDAMSLPQAMRSAPPHPRHRRRGTILIVAMILVFAIAALVLTLGLAMRVEASASANVAAEREATAIVRGAEQYVMAVLAESTDPIDLLDESYFEEVPLGGGYFWILRPAYDDPAMPVFGITDETCKI